MCIKSSLAEEGRDCRVTRSRPAWATEQDPFSERRKLISKPVMPTSILRSLSHHRPIQQCPVWPLLGTPAVNANGWDSHGHFAWDMPLSLSPTRPLGFQKLFSWSHSRYFVNGLNLAFKNKSPCIYIHLKMDQRKRSC